MARALEYRTRQNIDPSAVSLAVVVQVMVPTEASGIIFTIANKDYCSIACNSGCGSLSRYPERQTYCPLQKGALVLLLEHSLA